jgi:hypothetical protein
MRDDLISHMLMFRKKVEQRVGISDSSLRYLDYVSLDVICIQLIASSHRQLRRETAHCYFLLRNFPTCLRRRRTWGRGNNVRIYLRDIGCEDWRWI